MPLFRRRQRNQVYQQQRPIQNRNYCCEGHMIIGFILSLVAALLLTLVSLSTPIIKQITFLNTPTERYGAFGYCSTSASSTPGLPGLDGGEGCVRSTEYSTGPEITESMTRTAALFPLLAAVLMFITWITVILGMCNVGILSWEPKLYRTFAILGTLIAMIAEIFALAHWVTARKRFNTNGIDADYGAALWMGLAAAIIAFIGMCIGGPAFAGHRMYAADRTVSYNL